MSDDESFAPRLNHVAMTMAPESLDDTGRAEIRAFYGDVFGWTEGDNSGESGVQRTTDRHQRERRD